MADLKALVWYLKYSWNPRNGSPIKYSQAQAINQPNKTKLNFIFAIKTEEMKNSRRIRVYFVENRKTLMKIFMDHSKWGRI